MPTDLKQFEIDLAASLKRDEEAFDGRYSDAIAGLLGLSQEDIKAASPSIAPEEDYAKLISVVKEASRHNLAQAELRQQIEALGKDVVSVAKMVAPLASILA